MISFYYKQIRLKKSHIVYLFIYTYSIYLYRIYLYIVKNLIFSVNRNILCKNRNPNQKIRIKIRLTVFQTENPKFKILDFKLTKKI